MKLKGIHETRIQDQIWLQQKQQLLLIQDNCTIAQLTSKLEIDKLMTVALTYEKQLNIDETSYV